MPPPPAFILQVHPGLLRRPINSPLQQFQCYILHINSGGEGRVCASVPGADEAQAR